MNIFKKKMTLMAAVFSKLRTSNNLVTWMSKKSRFKGFFGKQHGKHAQILLKFAWQQLYHIYWSLWRQLSYKKGRFVIFKNSRLFPKTLIADGKYSLLNRDNLTETIQIKVSRKQKTFSQFFCCIFEIYFKFWTFLKKGWPLCWCSSETTDPEKHC